MGTRKGISSLLSSVKKNPDDQQKRSTTFEKLMQISPFDSEPNISEIAQQVSEKSVSKPVSKGQTKGQTSGQRNGLTKSVSKISDNNNDFPPSGEHSEKGIFYFRSPGEPRTKSEKILWKYLEKNQIIVNSRTETKTPGLFAAGDVTNCEFKQITIAAGQATIAALEAYQYLQLKSGKEFVAKNY